MTFSTNDEDVAEYHRVLAKQDSERHKLLHQRRRMLTRLVAGLFVADLVDNLTVIGGAIYMYATLDDTGTYFIGNPVACTIQGATHQVSSFLFPSYTFSITLFMLLTVLWERHTAALFVAEMMMHVCSWGLALASSLIPLAMSFAFRDQPDLYVHYHESGIAWCWLAQDPRWARFVFLYIWLWLAIVLVVIGYSVLSVIVWRRSRRVDSWSTIMATRKVNINWAMRFLWIYPLAFVAVWTLPTINRVLEATYGDVYVMSLAEGSVIPLQGFVDALIYGSTTLIPAIQAMYASRENDFQLHAYLDEAVGDAQTDVVLDFGSELRSDNVAHDIYSDTSNYLVD